MTDYPIDGYEATFTKSQLFKTWTWSVRTPDGRTLLPALTVAFMGREAAERAALDAIQTDASGETLTGDKLRQKVESEDAAKGNSHD